MKDGDTEAGDLNPAYLAAALRHARAVWHEAQTHRDYSVGRGERHLDLDAWNKAHQEMREALEALRRLAWNGQP